jgi:drug/metabolite transporter (DMT)-like permease
MEVWAVVFCLVGALAQGTCNVLRKYILNKKILAEGEVRFVPQLIGAVFCGLWFFIAGEAFDLLTPSKPDLLLFAIGVLGSVTINVVIHYANVRSIVLGDASLVAPIQAMTPGLIVFAAMLLGERPSLLGYVSIALIAIGTYIHAREGARSWQEFLQPLFVWTFLRSYKQLTPEEQRNEELVQKQNNARALFWAYLSAVCGTIGLMFDSTFSRYGDAVLGSALWCFLIGIIFSPGIRSGREKLRSKEEPHKPPSSFRERFRAHAWLIVATGVLVGIQYPLFATAFRLAPVAYVGSLKRLTIMVTVTLAVIYLGETKSAKRRLTTASIIVLGAIGLAFDPTQANLTNSFVDYLTNLVR